MSTAADSFTASFVVDRHLKVLTVHPACADVLRPLRLRPGAKFGAAWRNADARVPRAAMLRCLTDGESVIVEDFWLASARWIEYEIRPASIGLIVTVAERTRERATLDSTRETNDEWSSTSAAAAVGLGRLGLDGYWISANARGLAILGRRNEDLRECRLVDFCTGQQNEEDKRELVRLLRGEATSFTSERAILRTDGRQLWVRFHFSLTRATPCHPPCLAVVFDDIEDRKASEISLQFALQSAAMGDWDYDATLDQTRRSARFTEIFGDIDPESDWTYQTFVERVATEDRLAFSHAFREALITGRDLSVEVRVTGAPAGPRWVILSGRVYLNRQGYAVRMAGLVRDVTAPKLAEIELNRAKAHAEDANREKSNFLANMSHEIRTPLAAILGFTNVLLESELNADERRDYLSILSRNGQNLSRLIDDILDLSKVEAGHLEVERIAVQPAAIIRDVLALLSLGAEAKGIALTHQTTGLIPAWILGDASRLRQILTNVIGNAIKFTTRGTVTLETVRTGDALMFRVIDTGPGMNAAAVSTLFRPFSQADSSTARVYGGTGLGLALSQRLARAMDGDLTLETTTLGAGSTFTLKLPIEIAEAPRTAEPVEAAPAAAALRPPSTLRVLLADDSPDNQELIKYLLDRRGAQTTLADDGQRAIDLAQQADFDLVLMDMQMPRVDGYEATRRLRQSGFSAPIVALTAHAMRSDRDRCLSAGCSEYLTKPIDAKSLYRVMDQAVALTQN